MIYTRVIRRLEDMSPDGYLELMQCEDGDIHVTVRESGEKGFGSSVEFCLSGSRSPRTREALRKLMDAMEADEKRAAAAGGDESREDGR